MTRWKTVLGVIAGLAVSGCVSQSDIEEIKANQKEILEKLAEVGKGGARPQRPQAGRPDPTTVYAVPVDEAHTKGGNDAWVTIVEFSDFQCPFCNRVNPTLKQVQEKFGDKVKIAFRHNALSFHKRAKPAALAAECAGDQGKFWEMHDQMFANQKALEDADLEGYAKAIGVNVGKWKSCYDGRKHEKKVDNDQKTAMTFGARGTPAFFVNGRFLSGAQPFPKFESLINEELKKAESSGISKKEYYAKSVLAKGKKKL